MQPNNRQLLRPQEPNRSQWHMWLEAKDRSQGEATRALQLFTEACDALNVSVILEAQPMVKTMDFNSLVRLYTKHGFVKSTKHSDIVHFMMIRKPQKPHTKKDATLKKSTTANTMSKKKIQSIRDSSIDPSAIGDDSWDPGSYLAGLVEHGLTESQSMTVFKDERLDVPRAGNFMEFCQSDSYLKFPAFPRMLQIASHMLGEICYFCSDEDYSYQLFDQEIGEITERIMFTRFGKCPRCGRTRFDFLRHRKWFFPEALIAILGQRSGKNYLLAQLACYQIHRFMTLEMDETRVSPHKYLHLGPGMLTMTFTAVTLGQATKNIWNVFSPVLHSGPWFQEYFKYLDHHGKKMGEELYTDNATYLRFRHKLIDISCAAPNQSTLRGPTRIGFGIDEICHHDVNTEHARKKDSSVLGSIESIHTSLNNSLKTVRHAGTELMKAGDYDAPTAYDWSISSPCHANDIGMRRLRLADNGNPRIYGAHFATWQVNPEFKNGQADFAAEYAISEEEADRNFAAIPPLTVSPWIQDPKPILLAVRPILEKQVVSYEMRTEQNVFGTTTSWYELKGVLDSGTPRVLSVDNGYNNNAFALTLSSLDRSGKPYIDQCVLLKPNENYVVNLSKMWDHFIYPIITKCNIALILYDRWNSIQNIQKLQDEERDARQYSLTPKDFQSFRQRLMNGEVSYPYSEYSPKVFLDYQLSENVDLVSVANSKPGFALLLQTLTVRLIGGRVQKPLYGDDDVFRTAMLGLKFLNDPEIAPKLSVMGRSGQANNGPRFMGMVKPLSGGGGGTGMRSNTSQGNSAVQKPRTLCVVRTKS